MSSGAPPARRASTFTPEAGLPVKQVLSSSPSWRVWSPGLSDSKPGRLRQVLGPSAASSAGLAGGGPRAGRAPAGGSHVHPTPRGTHSAVHRSRLLSNASCCPVTTSDHRAACPAGAVKARGPEPRFGSERGAGLGGTGWRGAGSPAHGRREWGRETALDPASRAPWPRAGLCAWTRRGRRAESRPGCAAQRAFRGAGLRGHMGALPVLSASRGGGHRGVAGPLPPGGPRTPARVQSARATLALLITVQEESTWGGKGAFGAGSL